MLEFEFSLAGVFALIFFKSSLIPVWLSHISTSLISSENLPLTVDYISGGSFAFPHLSESRPLFLDFSVTSSCLFVYLMEVSLFFPLQILRKQNHVTSSSELYLQPFLLFSLAFSLYFAVLVYKTVSWVCSSYIWFTAYKCDLYISIKQ